MVAIGKDIHVTRSMSHHQQRQYDIFNHPIGAQRECSVMLLLQSKPMHTNEIASALGDSSHTISQCLTTLRKAQLVRKHIRWYLVAI